MIYKRGKNGTYWMRFRFAGRFIHESTRTQRKTIARDAERERRRKLELSINRLKERPSLPPNLEKAAEAWQADHAHEIRPNTQHMVRFALDRVLPVFGKKLLCDIDAEGIRDYQRKRLSQGAQGRTINIEVGVLRQILKAAEDDYWTPLAGHIKMLPERKDIGRALTPEEEYRLLEVAHSLDSACYTAVVLALNTGLRHSEICGLQWQQIDLGQRTLTVGRSKTTAGTGRLIPLNHTAFDALARWAGRSAEAKPEHYLFPFCKAGQVDATRPAQGWRKAWRHALALAGFKCRFHDLRHTAITKLAEGQASEQTILAIAGHMSRRMLERYSHVRTAAKRTALDGLKPVFEAGVHQNLHQIQSSEMDAPAKLLN